MVKEELTVEERLEYLEENTSYIVELLETNNKAYLELIKILNSLMNSSNRQQREVQGWVENIEVRLGKLIVEQVNHSLIIGEAITLNAEQRRNIQRKIEELNQIAEEQLEDNKEANNAPKVETTSNQEKGKEEVLRGLAKQVGEKKAQEKREIPSNSSQPLINKKPLKTPRG